MLVATVMPLAMRSYIEDRVTTKPEEALGVFAVFSCNRLTCTNGGGFQPVRRNNQTTPLTELSPSDSVEQPKQGISRGIALVGWLDPRLASPLHT